MFLSRNPFYSLLSALFQFDNVPSPNLVFSLKKSQKDNKFFQKSEESLIKYETCFVIPDSTALGIYQIGKFHLKYFGKLFFDVLHGCYQVIISIFIFSAFASEILTSWLKL